jgi:hypothetical protein
VQFRKKGTRPQLAGVGCNSEEKHPTPTAYGRDCQTPDQPSTKYRVTVA